MSCHDTDNMKITISQSRGQIDDPQANISKAKMVISNVEADLFIFPEMFMCGYVKVKEKMFFKILEGRTIDKMKELSAKKGCAMVFGIPVQDDGKIYNTAMFLNGEDKGVYKKIHLDPDLNEDKLFTPGSEPLCFEYKGLKFGLAISNDLYYPELFRSYAEKDVDIVICISAASDNRMKGYDKLLAARALENSLNIIFVNMVGPDPGEMMVGRSKWIGSDGNVIEGCTESSDVRVLRINDSDIKAGERKKLKGVRKDITW
jgi:Predicted amidohydrolase